MLVPSGSSPSRRWSAGVCILEDESRVSRGGGDGGVRSGLRVINESHMSNIRLWEEALPRLAWDGGE